MAVTDDIRVQQIETVGQGIARTGLRVSDANVVAIGGKAAPYGRVENLEVLEIGFDDGKATGLRVEGIDVVIIGGEGVFPTQALEVNSFQYDLDGHIFYGIHVRDRGTFVYDQATGQWAQWQSGNLTYWNAQFCIRWNDDYYAQNLLDNYVVKIDPTSVIDDSFRDNDFIVTGRLESQSRKYIPNSEVHLFGSVGLRGGDVSLRYSDDDGATFTSYIAVTVPAGERQTNVMWYDLGSITSPGRVYQIQDLGTIRRIQTLNAKLVGEEGS